MKPKKPQLVMAVLISGLVFLSSSALAFSPGGRGEHGPGPGGPGKGQAMMPGGPQLMASLNLTDQQIDKLKEQKFSKRKQMIQLQAERETLELELEKEVSADQPSTGKIEKIAGKMGELQGRMIAERASSIVFLKSILTEEQKKIMAAHHLAPGGHGMGRPGGRGRGKGKH